MFFNIFRRKQCCCGPSDLLLDLWALLDDLQGVIFEMSDNLDALKAAVADVSAKVDIVLAQPPVVVSDGVDEALPAVTAELKAIADKLAPPAS